MPYAVIRRGGQVTVYYHEMQTGRNVALPRAETNHLDGEPREVIDRWMADWESSSGISRNRTRRRSLLDIDELRQLLDVHLEDHKIRRSIRPGTAYQYQYLFDNLILPYFVTKHGSRDVRRWYEYLDQFPTYLLVDRKLQISTVRKACHTLLRFGRFLVRRRIISEAWLLELPRTRERRRTPLTRRIDPADVFSLVTQLDTEGKLVVLLGYFGSLRPEELYALSREDFCTGDEARARAKTYKQFQKYSLGSGLSVEIRKTLIKREVEELTKTHYARGMVNIFSVEAARVLAGILSSLPPGRLFPGTRFQIDGRFDKYIRRILGVTCQDLRRASANYLGRRRAVDPYTLQDHLRHAEMTTTLLYVRDPSEAEDKNQASQVDFTDVG